MTTQLDTGARQPNRQAIRYFIIGQLGFFTALIVCVLLLPQGMRANRGFSYFGDYSKTMLFYHLAFVICSVCTLLASFALPSVMPFRVVKYVFWLLPVLLFGVAVTTVPHSPMWDNVHRPIGVALFLLQFSFGVWLARCNGKDWFSLLWFLLLFSSGLVSLLALFGILHCLLAGQVFFQFAFAMLVIRGLSKMQVQP